MEVAFVQRQPEDDRRVAYQYQASRLLNPVQPSL